MPALNSKIIFTGSNRVWETNDWQQPTFSISPADCTGKGYQGWSNSATCLFNLYLMQEQPLIKEFEGFIRKDGTVSAERIIRWFQRLARQQVNPIVIDKWCQGIVNVREIIENFLDDNDKAKALREAAAK